MLVPGLVDAAGAVDLASRHQACTTDCLLGVLQFPAAPTVTPVLAAGVGGGDRLALGPILAGYAVVLALTAAWWWLVGGRVPWRRAWWALPAAVAFTVAVKVPFVWLADTASPAVAAVPELAVWGAVVHRLRAAPVRPGPRGPGTGR